MILFTASWCEPCKAVKNYLNNQYKGVLSVTVVDIDNDSDGLFDKHKVKGIPCLVTDEERFHGAPAITKYLAGVQTDV